jgi:hypothetical protein
VVQAVLDVVGVETGDVMIVDEVVALGPSEKHGPTYHGTFGSAV